MRAVTAAVEFDMEESPKYEAAKASCMQIGGNHYRDLAIQPVEFIYANRLDFLQGNAIKYIVRFRHKNGKEDLLKARHYIDLLIELEYQDTNN